MKILEILKEGTWAVPNTVDKALAIVELMKHPIPANKASDMLYNLFGDDDLFDSIYEIEQKDGPEDDIRPVLELHIQKLIRNFDPNNFRDEFDADAIQILQTIRF